MRQRILEMTLTINRQKAGRQPLTLVSREETADMLRLTYKGESVCAVLTAEESSTANNGTIWKCSIALQLQSEAFRENDNLAAAAPVAVGIKFSVQPQRMTALHLHRDWWTRPAFIQNFDEMPERTQVLCMEYDAEYGCLLPMAGNAFKTMAKAGKPGELTLEMTAYMGGISKMDETVFYLAGEANIYAAVRSAFAAALAQKGLPGKSQKEYPEMFEYLGWCSWDAFYTDISEKKVRKKADELAEKQVPVRWFLMDDGWLSVREQRLYHLMPEKEKFPDGFRSMISAIKKRGSVDWFGVWHALGGYWGGLEPDSDAAVQEREHLYRTADGKCLPYPSAEKGYGFYRDWYEALRAEGIDFVKVDGQSAVKNYYENNLPVCQAARETHRALEGAAGAYMGGRLINCMGMAMENILGRPGSAISRNSDDFVPESENGFAEHLLQNGYNAVYHDEVYYCDWDMFWTHHRDAVKHGILRAVSGGPVYFSDRIGDTDLTAVLPLVYRDGRILRMDRAAKPSPDCIFHDPSKEGLLKLTNTADCGMGRKGGAIAVFNLCGRAERCDIGAEDIYDLSQEDLAEYYLYDVIGKCGRTICRKEHSTVTLPADGCGLYLLVPVIGGRACVGLADKYIAFHAIAEMMQNEAGMHIAARECGAFVFYQEQPPKRVLVNGIDVTDQIAARDNLYTVCGEGAGGMLITIE